MFVDDRPKYPMTFVVQFEFLGDIDRGVFQESIDKALLRHPMLRATIQPAKSSRDCWVLQEPTAGEIEWGDLDDPILIQGAGEYINLREENGFRCWVRHNRERAVMTSLFHHSAVDGIGAYQFLGDALWFYASHFETMDSGLADLEDSVLRKRMKANIGAELLSASEDDKNIKQTRSQPLAPSTDIASDPSGSLFPQFQSYTFEKDEYRALRLRAQDQGQNVNDLLLESLFNALFSWNESRGADVDAEDFCILMPLDLREADQPQFSAINLVTSSFIRRSANQIRDKAQLPATLREEVVKVKHSRHNSPFMRLLLHSPVDWNEAIKTYGEDDCLATAIFSNAGDPTRRFLVDLPRQRGVVKCGNLVLDDLSGASPIRSSTRVAVNIFTYRRRLKICMRFDPQSFAPGDGEAFLKQFLQCLADASGASE